MQTARYASLDPVGHFGRFEILGRLATGGMAEIFLAREVAPGGGARLVVVKRILPQVATDPRFVEMFLHEARLAMGLTHPNICAIHEVGEQDGAHYIAMEWVNGVSITQIHKGLFGRGERGLPMPVAVHIVAQVAAALQHAHAARGPEGQPLRLVHRDVTPDNIMVSFDGTVKLLDFGVAKAATQKQKTQTGLLKGKFAYMAPEQYAGEELDGRADIFSLGACLYEALTGNALFHRSSEFETMGAIVSEEDAPRVSQSLPDIPPRLDSVVARALAKVRQHRYQQAAEFEEDLSRCLMEAGEVVRDRHIAAFVQGLYPDLLQQGPPLERSMQLTHAQSQKLKGAVAHDLDLVTDELQSARKRRDRFVRATLSLVVVAAVAAVIYAALGSPPPPG